MIIYKMKLPASKDPDEFVTFMRDEYFPAIHKGATRVGKVLGLQLIQGGHDELAGSHDFYWLIEWNGLSQGEPRVDDATIAAAFNKFGVKPKRLGVFNKVASWSDDK